MSNDNAPTHTHVARIRPVLPHGTRMTNGIAFERLKGWYPVTPELAKYLAKQPAYEGEPLGARLFDAVTIEEAMEIDRLEKRPSRSGGSATNPTGLDGLVPPEKADTANADLLARFNAAEDRAAAAEARADGDRAARRAAEGQLAAQGDLLARIAEKIGIDLSTLSGTTSAPHAPPPTTTAGDETVPSRPARPGSVPRERDKAAERAAAKAAGNAPATPPAPAAEATPTDPPVASESPAPAG